MPEWSNGLDLRSSSLVLAKVRTLSPALQVRSESDKISAEILDRRFEPFHPHCRFEASLIKFQQKFWIEGSNPTFTPRMFIIRSKRVASVAQLIERQFRKLEVASLILTGGFYFFKNSNYFL